MLIVFHSNTLLPNSLIDLMLFSNSGNTPFVSASPSPSGQILASGPPVTGAKAAVSIFEVLLTFHLQGVKEIATLRLLVKLDSGSLKCIMCLMIRYFFNIITLMVSNRSMITII